MKGKKQLEIYLEGLEKKERYINVLEQYPTDSPTAAYILTLAFNDGNIAGKKILDLGTGNGIFACGAHALGAGEVLGVDVDKEQIEVATRNCGSDSVKFIVASVESVSGSYDTVIMNSPFGSVNVHADIPFLEKATETSDYIYSIHNFKSRDFVRSYYSQKGEIFREESVKVTVGRLYAHHKKDRAEIPSVFFSVRLKR